VLARYSFRKELIWPTHCFLCAACRKRCASRRGQNHIGNS